MNEQVLLRGGVMCEDGCMKCQVFQTFRSALPICSCGAGNSQAPHEYYNICAALESFNRRMNIFVRRSNTPTSRAVPISLTIH